MPSEASPGSGISLTDSARVLTSPAFKSFISSADAVSKEAELSRAIENATAVIDSLTSKKLPASTNTSHKIPSASSRGPQQTDTSEAIINQRIKIAVLENELKHFQQANQNLMNGFTVMLQCLTQGLLPTHPPPSHRTIDANDPIIEDERGTGQGSSSKEEEASEKEISRLRKENKTLKKSVRKLVGRAQEEGPIEIAPIIDDALITQEYAHNIEGENEPKHKGAIRDFRSFGPALTDLAGSWALSKYHTQNESFISTASTIPHPSSLKPAFLTKVQSAPGISNADVGMQSLEESFGAFESDDFGILPPSTVISTEKEQANLSSWARAELGEDATNLDDERDIDEQIEAQRKAMENFNSLPAPVVRKVNTQVQGSVRGKDYDPSNIPPAPRGPRMMRDFQRFTAPLMKRGSTLDTVRENGDEERGNGLKFPNLAFEDREDLDHFVNVQALNCGRSRDESRFPDLFRYGLQFIPGETDSNYMRTVMIGNLASDVTLRDVLARVRGGEILSATLLNTVPITGSWTARVVFKNEAAAEEYVEWTSANPITFGDGQVPATFNLVSTPTYPLSPRLSINLLRYNKSRCFCIPSFPQSLSLRTLEKNFACGNAFRAQSLIEIYLDEQGTLHLEFSDVDLASRAANIVGAWQNYEGCMVVWESDPCAGPLEELLEEPKSRPPMLPRSPPSTITLNSSDDGDAVVTQVQTLQRKRLAALASQKVEIPSFSSDRLQASSWADEVNEEVAIHDDQDVKFKPVPPNSPTGVMISGLGLRLEGMASIDTILAGSISQVVSDINAGSGSVGLAGSKYAVTEEILSPPRTKLEDLIGESESEAEKEVHPTTKSLNPDEIALDDE